MKDRMNMISDEKRQYLKQEAWNNRGIFMIQAVYAILIYLMLTGSGWLFWIPLLAMIVIWGLIPTFMLVTTAFTLIWAWKAFTVTINLIMGFIAKRLGLDFDPL